MSLSPRDMRWTQGVFGDWVNRRQLEVIDYLKEENRVLCEQLGVRRLRFTDDERRRLSSQLLEQPENRRARRRQASSHRCAAA